MGETRPFDVAIMGGGLIGLSIALELAARGANVAVLERAGAAGQASWAAAGMLAAEDPDNPPALLPLSRRSLELYPAFLRQVAGFSGMDVPYQTDRTLQRLHDGTTLHLREHSLDPRQLGTALTAAVRAAGVALLEHTAVLETQREAGLWRLCAGAGGTVTAATLVDARGAWASEVLPVSPRKGQMLRVRLPEGVRRDTVQRAERIYIVPRSRGEQAETALIGATVEDAGFDTDVRDADLAELRRAASQLIPELADERDAPTVEAWAGLRPATPDLLPILGRLPASGRAEDEAAAGHFVATGHFRNGVLLAPVTARVLADLIEGRSPELEIAAFSPLRFRRESAHRGR